MHACKKLGSLDSVATVFVCLVLDQTSQSSEDTW
jgi:hypothetical protein